jgi:hypothetical protein
MTGTRKPYPEVRKAMPKYGIARAGVKKPGRAISGTVRLTVYGIAPGMGEPGYPNHRVSFP